MPPPQAVWRMATEYSRDNISGVGLATFARLVSQRTGGLLAVETIFESGVGSGELIAAATNRSVEGGDAFAGPLEAVDPVFGLSSLPFVVGSIQEAKDLNRRARPAYEAIFARFGMTLLYFTVWPPTGLWSKRPLRGPDDIRALVIRAYDYKSAHVMQAAGAKAVYLPFREALENVKSGELNAILTSGDGGAAQGLWHALGHFTAISYAIPVSLAFVRADEFDALGTRTRDDVVACARETERRQFDLVERRTSENYRKMMANGAVISDPPPDGVISLLKDISVATVEAWTVNVPWEVVDLMKNRLSK